MTHDERMVRALEIAERRIIQQSEEILRLSALLVRPGPHSTEVNQSKYPLKRFLVFFWERWVTGGGWNEFEDSFDTLEAAQAYLLERIAKYEHAGRGKGQVVDIQTGEIHEP